MTETLTKKDVYHVPMGRLTVDHRYQRPLEKAMVNKLYKEFDPRMLGAIIVSRHPNGEFAILDGQTRKAAAALAGLPSMLCVVHDGLTLEEEARMFDTLNTKRKKVSMFDIHKARLLYGDPDAEFVQRVVDECGLKIVKSATKRGEVSALEPLYSLYSKVKLEAITPAYYKAMVALVADLSLQEDECVDREVLKGIGYLAQRNWIGPKEYERIRKIGLTRIHDGIKLVQIRNPGLGGGEKILATGIVFAMNYKLSTENKFILNV